MRAHGEDNLAQRGETAHRTVSLLETLGGAECAKLPFAGDQTAQEKLPLELPWVLTQRWGDLMQASGGPHSARLDTKHSLSQ